MVTHEQSEAPLLEDFWSLANQFMGPQADLLPVKQPSRSHVKFVLCRASYEPSDGNPVGWGLRTQSDSETRMKRDETGKGMSRQDMTR
jgi:hypothetical protein